MKKISILFAMVLMVLATLGLVSCGHEHEWSEWVTTIEPNAIEEGEAQRSCECGETGTKILSAYGKPTVLTMLSGKWIENGADTSGVHTVVEFKGGMFECEVLYGSTVMQSWTGLTEISENYVTLKTSSGTLVLQLTYKVGNGAIALLHVDGSKITEWVRY